jgi:uncharacterized membrane protein required for colicin V production
MMFNALDYLLIFFLLVGGLWGLLRGAGRLLIGLFSLYVGLVISLLLYRPLANFFRDLLSGMSITGSESLAFVFLLLALVNGFSFLTRYFATPPEERRHKERGQVQEAVTKGGQRFLTGPLNQLGGLLVGVLVAIVWISLLLAIFQFAVKAGWPAANRTRVAIQGQMNASVLVPVFNYALYRIYLSVKIWVPGEVPSIFAGLLKQI